MARRRVALRSLIWGSACVLAGAPFAASAQTSDPEATAAEIDPTGDQGPAAAGKAAGRDIVFMPIPVSNPSIGSGLALAAMALYRPGGAETPWTTGIGVLYTDSKSWAAGAFQKANFADDRFRLSGAAGTGDFHLDFYGIGADAGSRDVSIAIEQEAVFASTKGLIRVADGAYVGLMARYLSTTTSLDLEGFEPPFEIPPDLVIPDVQLDSTTVALGVAAEYDTRDSEYAPTEGLYGEGTWFRAAEGLGGDFDYSKLQFSLNGFLPLNEKTVAAGRIAYCDVGDDAPFYDLCSFGQGADLRGYVSGRFRDHALIAGQVELRHRFTRRFGAVAFAGVGTVASDFSNLGEGDLLPAAGVGLRYSASQSYGVNVSVDYAWGKDSHALYFRIGEAF